MGRKKLAQKLFEQHKDKLKLQRLKEQENMACVEAKRAFNRPVYPGLFSNPDRCGNDLGGR